MADRLHACGDTPARLQIQLVIPMIKTDVIIVGGGPAGAACASLLHEHHVDCVVLDRAAFPRAKPCAGWVTPAVFNLLQVKPADYPHSLTTFNSFEISLRGIKFRLPTHQYAIRRIEFDHWLLLRTNERVIQHKVENIESVNDDFIIDGQYQSKYLVGAGGTHCPVQRTFFERTPQRAKKRLILAKEAEFAYSYSDDRCHLWFFEGGLPGYAWYVPKAGGFLNIGIGGSATGLHTREKTLNDFWKEHLERLEKAGLLKPRAMNPIGYSYYLRGKPAQTSKRNVYLVGDAQGLATKDMGEGIGPAIQSGVLTAQSIVSQTRISLNGIPKYSFPSLLGFRK